MKAPFTPLGRYPSSHCAWRSDRRAGGHDSGAIGIAVEEGAISIQSSPSDAVLSPDDAGMFSVDEVRDLRPAAEHRRPSCWSEKRRSRTRASWAGHGY